MADAEGISVPMTGIADIDDQHQQLLACLDRLALWMSKGQGFAATFDAIATLNDYAASHFSFRGRLFTEMFLSATRTAHRRASPVD